ncbi:hypothetical protein SLS55_009558 [Diplodia seriata]|uniref:Sterigmatocystin biosynthesis monooxygenase stcW n=1 Tax=Diplodia seriata TaxID=420778 RepID=A0ABR3C3T1_9PEZI
MAPDLNSIAQGFVKDGRWDYSTPGSAGYDIPDTILDDPETRRVKVLTIGAGFSGIMLAYHIQKSCENVDFKIYEKNEDIGGTWLENRYPGCACDVPSHAYTYNFALNPDWPRYFSQSPDIWKYLDKVCEVFDLRKYMTFRTEVVEARWHEDGGKWQVKARQLDSAGNVLREFEEDCDVLLYATGILNNFRWPDLPGLTDKFKGRVVHTARWPREYGEEQWRGERVAVVGSGASSIQTVPNMQPHVGHLDVFVRTGVWFVQLTDNAEKIVEYADETKDEFRREPRKLVEHAKGIEDQVNAIFEVMFEKSEKQAKAQEAMRARMKEMIGDPRLVEGFTPKFQLGCRRVTPGDPYMEAVTKENVDVHFTAVERLTEHGVVGADGVERECDTVVCATGFDVTYRPRFPVVGRNGVDLAEKWKDAPESYLGITVPDMPNFFMYIGPTWPVENGSVAGPLGEVVNYTVKFIKKLQKDHIKSFAPKQHVTDQFNEHAQEWYKHTVWKDSCRSWYKNNDTGRVNAVWPGSSLHYMRTLQEPRYEDYEIKYENARNMWAFLGMGFVRENKIPGADLSPYLSLKEVDPKWLEAVGMDPEAPRKARLAELEDMARFGKKAQLKRIFGLVPIVGFTCCLVITWEAMLIVFQGGLPNGGNAGLIYGYIFVWFGTILQVLVMAEMASMIPLAGGQYNWVAVLSPPSCSKFLSYTTGWLCVIGWQCTVASAGYLSGTLIQGLLVLNYPDYEFQRWHGTLLHIAVILVALFFNTITKPLLPIVELILLGLHVVGFFALIIPLVDLAPHASPKEVFATFYNGGDWSSDGLSFFVGLTATMFAFVGK